MTKMAFGFNFRQFFEAEASRGRRTDSLTAAYETVSPFANSSRHLIAVAPRNYQPDLTQRQSVKFADTRAARLWTPSDPNIVVCGVRHFMDHGLATFRGTITWPHRHDQLMVHLLQMTPGSQVKCLDASDQTNPWIVMQTHFKDFLGDAEELVRKLPAEQAAKATEAIQGWKGRVETQYGNDRRPPNPQATTNAATAATLDRQGDRRRLNSLHRLVYIEGPRLLQWLKTGRSFQYKFDYRADPQRSNSFQTSSTDNFDLDRGNTHYRGDDFSRPKFAAGLDIILRTCPAATAAWGLVFNPRAVQTATVIGVPSDFQGFEQLADRTYRITGPESRAAAGLVHDLDAVVHNTMQNVEAIVNHVEHLRDHTLSWSRVDTIEKEFATFGVNAARITRYLASIRRIDPDFVVTHEPEDGEEPLAQAAQAISLTMHDLNQRDEDHRPGSVYHHANTVIAAFLKAINGLRLAIRTADATPDSGRKPQATQ